MQQKSWMLVIGLFIVLGLTVLVYAVTIIDISTPSGINSSVNSSNLPNLTINTNSTGATTTSESFIDSLINFIKAIINAILGIFGLHI